RGIVRVKCLGAFIGRLVATKMLGRVRGLVDMRLGSAGRGEHHLVAGLDQRHRRQDRLVEILAGGTPPAALGFNPGRVGTDDQHFSLAHDCLLLRWVRLDRRYMPLSDMFWKFISSGTSAIATI